MDYQRILHFWFGDGVDADVPSPARTQLWFGEDPQRSDDVLQWFGEMVLAASQDEYSDWQDQPRSSLALILLLDQIPRIMHRKKQEAYAHDQQALRVCLKGLAQHHDQQLSLIERVFYYMPLQHSEQIEMQKASVEAYQALLDVALEETSELFNTFLSLAVQSYEVIRRFGRFPERNNLLHRQSTPEEQAFLAQYPA